jgi:hypothetical protein
MFLVHRSANQSGSSSPLDFKKSKPTFARINGSARATMCDQIFIPAGKATQSSTSRGVELYANSNRQCFQSIRPSKRRGQDFNRNRGDCFDPSNGICVSSKDADVELPIVTDAAFLGQIRRSEESEQHIGFTSA